jgi:hypothetical protein
MGSFSFALALIVSLSNANAPASLQPCELPRLPEPARCGVLEVFEDRAAARGRKIPIRVVVLPATGSPHAPDLLFILQLVRAAGDPRSRPAHRRARPRRQHSDFNSLAVRAWDGDTPEPSARNRSGFGGRPAVWKIEGTQTFVEGRP